MDFLRRNRESVESAWQFETTHDSDGDGIYDNSQGTGWVESWPPGMPHQEIYLALLDQQTSAAMSELASLLDDKATAATAATRAQELTKKIEAEYYVPASQTYAFSWNKGGVPRYTRCEAPFWYCHGCRGRIMLSIPPQLRLFGGMIVLRKPASSRTVPLPHSRMLYACATSA